MRLPRLHGFSARSTCCQRVEPKIASRSFADQQSGTSQSATPSRKQKKNHRPRQVIFSGIQPTGVPHLGNYLGALRQWKQFQDDKTREKDPMNYQLLFSIVDLHALTLQQDRTERVQLNRESFASLLAIGLDPQHSILFVQSHVEHHAQLMWILSTVASMGQLSRMTQWKSKAGLSDDATLLDEQSTRDNLRLGLFSYPVLQAADILLYRPHLVPVGEDQAQHVEFARNVAKSFHAYYGPAEKDQAPLFNLPKLYTSPAKRVMSLKDPTKKMSKSDKNPLSRILINDTPEEIRSKIKGALTDMYDDITYDVEARPGISNLIEILKHVQQSTLSCEEIAKDHRDNSKLAFKEHVADSIIKALDGIRDRFREIMYSSDDTILDDAIFHGSRRASSIAGVTMAQVRKNIGITSRDKPSVHKRENALSKKEAIQREQLEEEQSGENEPDVMPQKEQGLDQPVAS